MKSKEKEQIMRDYGWSETIENQFFTFANQIIGEKFKGRFTIKKNNQTNTWFWYYRFSSTTLQPRTKYLCSCDEPTSTNKSSFDNATQKLLEKIDLQVASNPQIEISENSIQIAIQKFKILNSKMNILLGIGGSGPTKRIPADKFKKFISNDSVFNIIFVHKIN